MQALLAGFANVALKYTHTCCKLAAAAVSAYSRATVWLFPDPAFGVTETAVGVPESPATVQKPSDCHPLPAPAASRACKKMLLAPAYVGLKVIGTVHAKVLPLG